MLDINLNIAGVEDGVVRDNLDQLQEFLSSHPLLKFRGKHIELTFTGNLTNYRYKHNLGYRPRDIIMTSEIGTGSITWNYSLFDRDEIDITTSGVSGDYVIRAFIGSYVES